MKIFKAIAQIRPSKNCVESPSNITPPLVVTDAEAEAIADSGGKSVLVSTAKDGVSDAKQTTVYSVPGKVGRWIFGGDK